MSISFVAERNPSSGISAQVEALSPTNPFATAAYAASTRIAGEAPWVVGLREHGTLKSAAFAYERAGRINRTFTISSVPDISDAKMFWDSIVDLCHQANFSRLEVNSFASPPSALPILPGEFSRRKRWEFVVDLRDPDLWKKTHDNHRRRIKKSQKVGIEFRCSSKGEDTNDHARVIAASMERRTKRGEYVPTVQETSGFRAFLETGAGKLFQAVNKGEVLSSAMVLVSKTGGYLQSGGTSPEGMELGASHFLQHEIMKTLQSEGKELYNLGGTDEPESGLAMFKIRFGAHSIPLEATEVLVGKTMRAAVAHLARRVQAHSSNAGQMANQLKSKLKARRQQSAPVGKPGGSQ
jgi:GNAT acetyltransferase-like protein